MKIESFSLKFAAIIPFALWLAIYFLGLGQTAITDPNEGYYVEAGREMVENGNWLIPHLNYQIYFSKPILNFWLIAIPYKLFGVSEFSARISFSILAFLLFTGVMLFANRLAGARCGILAAVICATAPLMIAASRISPIDVALTCFLSLALFAWALSYIFKDSRFWPYFYLFMALAVLTKGPAALLLVLIAITVFLLVDFFVSKKNRIRSVAINLMQTSVFNQLILGCLMFLLVTLPWYIAVSQATKGLFLQVFLIYENLARFAGHTNYTGRHWYHYFPVLIYSFVPWVLLLIPATQYVFSAYLRPNISGADDKENERTSKTLVFLFCYAAVLFVILSRSGTQMDTYLLPAIPALSVVAGYYLNEVCLAISSRKSNTSTMHIMSIAMVVLGLSLLLALLIFVALPVVAVIKTPFSIIIFICAIGCLSQYYFKQTGSPWLMLTAFCLTVGLVCAFSFHAVCYIIDQSGQRDLKNLCLLYKRSNDHLSMFHAFKPSILFYTERPVDCFFHPQELNLSPAQTASNVDMTKKRLLIFVSDQFLPLLTAVPDLILKPLARQGQWQVVLAENANLKKQPTLEEIFRHTQVLRDAMTGPVNWGPLTVPYTAGTELPHLPR